MKLVGILVCLTVTLGVLGAAVPFAGTVTDIDGNTYQTVMVGTQVWMKENVRVTRYRNGAAIPNVTDNTEWGSRTTGAYCEYNGDINNAAIYGRLYNWYAVADSQNIAPTGWHVASDAEWKQLEMTLGLSQVQADAFSWRGTIEGGKLKQTGTSHWRTPNIGASNESGFSALPGGERGSSGGWYYMGTDAIFWSSTENTSNSSWARILTYIGSDIGRLIDSKVGGFAVRCVKDDGCCSGTRGDVNAVGGVDLSDLSALVSYLTGGSFLLPCIDAANLNGKGCVDLSDLSSLVSYLTGGTFALPMCP